MDNKNFNQLSNFNKRIDENCTEKSIKKNYFEFISRIFAFPTIFSCRKTLSCSILRGEWKGNRKSDQKINLRIAKSEISIGSHKTLCRTLCTCEYSVKPLICLDSSLSRFLNGPVHCSTLLTVRRMQKLPRVIREAHDFHEAATKTFEDETSFFWCLTILFALISAACFLACSSLRTIYDESLKIKNKNRPASFFREASDTIIHRSLEPSLSKRHF